MAGCLRWVAALGRRLARRGLRRRRRGGRCGPRSRRARLRRRGGERAPLVACVLPPAADAAPGTGLWRRRDHRACAGPPSETTSAVKRWRTSLWRPSRAPPCAPTAIVRPWPSERGAALVHPPGAQRRRSGAQRQSPGNTAIQSIQQYSNTAKAPQNCCINTARPFACVGSNTAKIQQFSAVLAQYSSPCNTAIIQQYSGPKVAKCGLYADLWC